MSRTRRNFTAQFKAKLVLEVLKGEKDINTIATENNIQPNLLRNWKKEFLDNASIVFDDKREENIKEKLSMRNFNLELFESGLIGDKTSTFGKKELNDFANCFDREIQKKLKKLQ